MSNIKTLMEDALMVIADKAPYIYSSVLALERVETDKCPTASVDKHFRMYYNPEFMLEQGKDSAAFIIIHE